MESGSCSQGTIVKIWVATAGDIIIIHAKHHLLQTMQANKIVKRRSIMYLSGTPNERIGDLRTKMGLSQKELSAMIEISASQLSRIENGETQSIGSDTLVKLSKVFGVSTDYIFGLTTISTPKSHDISELGLSEGAVKGLLNGTVDVQILNRLLEHKSFSYLLYLIKTYFDNSLVAGIMARNALIDMATTTLGDFIKENPKHKKEVKTDMKFMKSQKLADNEAEIEKIKSIFVAILKDIKKDVENDKPTDNPATAEFLQSMKEQILSTKQKQNPIKQEDVIAGIMGMIGNMVELDEKSVGLFSELVNGLVKQE